MNKQSSSIMSFVSIVLLAINVSACTQNQSAQIETTQEKTIVSNVSAKSVNEHTDTNKPLTQTNIHETTNTSALKKIATQMTVYKDEHCGCCSMWVEHAKENGFSAKVEHPKDLTAIKDKFGVPSDMRSCHTTMIDDYVFEGHIPSKYIQQFLANPPKDALGLTVPGMPVGSPGMEYKNKFLPYKVFQINKDGSTTVYSEVTEQKEQFTL